MNAQLLQNIEAWVEEAFAEHTARTLTYHNIHHTRNVVDRCGEIASHMKIVGPEMNWLLTAAWFHDLGQLFVGSEEHEGVSALLMSRRLNALLQETETMRIARIIAATRYPTHPKNILEAIICDADTYHFGTQEFERTDKLVQAEMEERSGRGIDDWTRQSLNMLRHHRFYTPYCQERLQAGKAANIARLEAALR